MNSGKEAPAWSSSPASAQSSIPDPRKTATVYIIDDDPSVRKAMARLMRTAGLQESSFSSVEQFMNAGVNDAHACIVADVRISGTSGLDLPGLLAKSGRSIPVIFVTAQDSEEIRAVVRKLGAAGYFRKPVDDQALIDSIRWALGNSANSVQKNEE